MNAPLLIAQPTLAHARVPDSPQLAHWGEDIKRILCVRLDNLGDVLMTTPALHALRESGPGRHITLLGSRSGAALAPYLDDVDDVIEYEAPWVAAVKRATQIVVRHATPIEPPYAVELEIRIQKAKNRRKGAVAWPTVGDVDKLARSTIDGLAKGGALEDDRHVTALTVRKRFTRREETPGVTARVTQDAQMQDLSAAA